MRVAYLVSQYPAPSHTFIRREVAALKSRGVPIRLFSVRRPTPEQCTAPEDREAYDETQYLLPASLLRLALTHLQCFLLRPVAYLRTLRLALSHRVPGLHALIWSLFHFAEAMLLARALERARIQHLHNHFANSGANVGLLASRYLGLPWSLTLHGISETDYPSGPLLARKIEAAEFVACVSHFGRAQAMRVVGQEHWKKLFLVRCGVDMHAMPARTMSHPRRRPRVICVGRLSPEKGHLGLLQAFSEVRDRGLDAELVLVGDGPEREHIEQAIEARGLREHVTLRGALCEHDAVMEVATSDVLVLASFMEGLPVVLMEAMALGVPVIGPRVAGVPELVQESEQGLLFSPGAWDELAEHLSRLLRDPVLRQRLGRAGQTKVLAQFEVTTAVEPLCRRFAAGPPDVAASWELRRADVS